jgi:PAS domain S-box-containing protein
MASNDQVNVLLVDDQPAKLLAYETVLQDLGENLIKASSAREALQYLLKTDVAILLIDVCMPELDGFQLAAMIREHPRFQRTAIIFISAIHLTDMDLLKGYEMGAVDYVPVPVVPEVLRAKVKVFAELYRKTRQLEQLNTELEARVAERTAELEASNARLRESERRRSLALAAGQMGSWEWDVSTGACVWDAGQYRIFGVESDKVPATVDGFRSYIHPDDFAHIQHRVEKMPPDDRTFQSEIRILQPDGKTRWCICAAAMTADSHAKVTHVSGVMIDITALKEAEARRALLVREVDHRARNALAIVQAIVRMTKAKSLDAYVATVQGRIGALSIAHSLISESRWEGTNLDRLVNEELAPYHGDSGRILVSGPGVFLKPQTAQIIALVLHELTTNSAKYGALSQAQGKVALSWQLQQGTLDLQWQESGGPPVLPPLTKGYGTRIILASVVQQLGGTAKFDWQSTGLQFTMSIGLSKKLPGGEADFPSISHASASGKDRHVLVVEDEALVGMMMREFLTELGFPVVGPFSKAAPAIEAVKRERILAAVLDVNLGGEMIYDLADELTGRGIPIVFVTGYGSDAIDARFASVPILQKPVDAAALQRILNAVKESQLH